MNRLSAACLCALLGFAGCQQPIPPTEASRLAIDDADTSVVWDACLATLRQHRFQIDRRDRHAGVITTFPETSQNFFEFWRHDVDTPHDFLEASIKTVRRWVDIQVSSDEEPGDRTLELAVHKERFHTIERQVPDAAIAFRAFSVRQPTTAGRPFRPEEDAYWTSEGRDAAMEQRLLRIIQQRIDEHL